MYGEEQLNLMAQTCLQLAVYDRTLHKTRSRSEYSLDNILHFYRKTTNILPYSILLGVLEPALHEIVGKLLTVKLLNDVVFYTKKRCHSSPS